MVKIVDPELHVEHLEGHPGARRLVVTYRLAVPEGDPAIGRRLQEVAVVSARDEHDAPVLPSDVEFRLDDEVVLESVGAVDRRLVRDVHRVDLDVERDWWETDQAGGTTPIAEFVDHLAAVVTVCDEGNELAHAETPVVTGSWGALGTD